MVSEDCYLNPVPVDISHTDSDIDSDVDLNEMDTSNEIGLEFSRDDGSNSDLDQTADDGNQIAYETDHHQLVLIPMLGPLDIFWLYASVTVHIHAYVLLM